MYYYNGNYYEGELIKGTEIKHGRGLYIAKDYIYEGYWKNDQYHGRGLKIYDDGGYFLCGWDNGEEYGDGIKRISGIVEPVVFCKNN